MVTGDSELIRPRYRRFSGSPLTHTPVTGASAQNFLLFAPTTLRNNSNDGATYENKNGLLDMPVRTLLKTSKPDLN